MFTPSANVAVHLHRQRPYDRVAHRKARSFTQALHNAARRVTHIDAQKPVSAFRAPAPHPGWPGRLSAVSASITASNSIRLLVVPSSPPKSSFSVEPERSSTPQPPGPGLPLHAPSV